MVAVQCFDNLCSVIVAIRRMNVLFFLDLDATEEIPDNVPKSRKRSTPEVMAMFPKKTKPPKVYF